VAYPVASALAASLVVELAAAGTGMLVAKPVVIPTAPGEYPDASAALSAVVLAEIAVAPVVLIYITFGDLHLVAPLKSSLHVEQ
jgi:hypothetical protein